MSTKKLIQLSCSRAHRINFHAHTVSILASGASGASCKQCVSFTWEAAACLESRSCSSCSGRARKTMLIRKVRSVSWRLSAR
eukprot:1835309-Pleurochrysis_carterae.AAC.8